ncbi:MAG: MerR family transcriptional regulator [Gammaproteobacteria bacterium]|nr:MerR family transcriptional regulator [Gammaproteobacteria bacterium]
MSQELFPIRTVSELTGVNSVTLRAWERRYGLIKPARTESGHRLYSAAHVERIFEVLALLEKGVSISQVKQSFDSREEKQQELDVFARTRDKMFDAVTRFDDATLEAVYTGALSEFPVDMITANIILPLLERLGERWREQPGGIAEEHFFGFYLRNKLGARFHHRQSRASGKMLLMSCLPGEQHDIGLLLFALAAHETGYRVTVLGADLPLTELEAAARRIQCDAIVVSGSAGLPASVVEQLTELISRVQVPLFVGGRFAVSHRDAITAAGADVLGNDLGRGLAMLRKRVPPE